MASAGADAKFVIAALTAAEQVCATVGLTMNAASEVKAPCMRSSMNCPICKGVPCVARRQVDGEVPARAFVAPAAGRDVHEGGVAAEQRVFLQGGLTGRRASTYVAPR